MRVSRVVFFALQAAALFLTAAGRSAWALPTMIRLGYPNCVSCHITPQGGGLLNSYGRGIDKAQSLLGGEYVPLDSDWFKMLNWNGRITQDFRSIIQQQDTSTTGRAGTQLFRSRVMYRNATELGKGFRFTATLTGENQGVTRPNVPYDSPARQSQLFVNTALLSYRAKALEVSAGRDQLPTGLNIPDLGAFIKSRNHLGYYDAPTQLKATWWGGRYYVSSYAFGPGGNEAAGHHESGGGVLAEFDLRGNRRTVVGMNLLRGTATSEDRTQFGPYARLGFGKWGILAEHDFTNRNWKMGTPASFGQTTSYGQLFWAAREWLVPSLIVERLSVDRPYQEHLLAAKLEVSARVSSYLTVSIGPRLQRDQLTGRMSRSIVFQVAMKGAR
ncbi:MAG: hypothetical protein ABJF23_16875 [Bryobacteraceae bacterium]